MARIVLMAHSELYLPAPLRVKSHYCLVLAFGNRISPYGT
jgi:hypothetical protein